MEKVWEIVKRLFTNWCVEDRSRGINSLKKSGKKDLEKAYTKEINELYADMAKFKRDYYNELEKKTTTVHKNGS